MILTKMEKIKLNRTLYNEEENYFYTKSATKRFIPRSKEEIELQVGDVIKMIYTSEEKEWMAGKNQRTKKIGFFPKSHVSLDKILFKTEYLEKEMAPVSENIDFDKNDEESSELTIDEPLLGRKPESSMNRQTMLFVCLIKSFLEEKKMMKKEKKLKEKTLSKQEREMIDMVSKESNLIVNLIENILDEMDKVKLNSVMKKKFVRSIVMEFDIFESEQLILNYIEQKEKQNSQLKRVHSEEILITKSKKQHLIENKVGEKTVSGTVLKYNFVINEKMVNLKKNESLLEIVNQMEDPENPPEISKVVLQDPSDESTKKKTFKEIFLKFANKKNKKNKKEHQKEKGSFKLRHTIKTFEKRFYFGNDLPKSVINGIKVNEKTIVSTFCDGSIASFDTETLKCSLVFEEKHLDWPSNIISVKENVIATSCYAGALKVWDLDQNSTFYSIENAHSSAISSLKSFGTNELITSSFDGTIKVWDSRNISYNSKLNFTNLFEFGNSVVCFEKNENVLCAGLNDGKIVVFDLRKPNQPFNKTEPSNDRWVNSLSLFNSKKIHYGCSDGSLFSWDFNENKSPSLLSKFEGGVTQLKSLPRDPNSFATSSLDGSLNVKNNPKNNLKIIFFFHRFGRIILPNLSSLFRETVGSNFWILVMILWLSALETIFP